MKSIIAILVLAALAVGGHFLFTREANAPAGEGGNTLPPSGKIIEITVEGFKPNTITVKARETVSFVNKDSTAHWPASAAHPTHLVYPGSDIKKCGTADQVKIFDACRGLKTGESFSFQFSEKGSWKYHDHLNPASPFFGTVVVE